MFPYAPCWLGIRWRRRRRNGFSSRGCRDRCLRMQTLSHNSSVWLRIQGGWIFKHGHQLAGHLAEVTHHQRFNRKHQRAALAAKHLQTITVPGSVAPHALAPTGRLNSPCTRAIAMSHKNLALCVVGEAGARRGEQTMRYALSLATFLVCVAPLGTGQASAAIAPVPYSGTSVVPQTGIQNVYWVWRGRRYWHRRWVRRHYYHGGWVPGRWRYW